MAQAAAAAGWAVERLAGWRPGPIDDAEIVLYGEPPFAAVVADPLGVQLLEPAADWLATLPKRWTQRWVHAALFADAKKIASPTFVKPAVDKCFHAGVVLRPCLRALRGAPFVPHCETRRRRLKNPSREFVEAAPASPQLLPAARTEKQIQENTGFP